MFSDDVAQHGGHAQPHGRTHSNASVFEDKLRVVPSQATRRSVKAVNGLWQYASSSVVVVFLNLLWPEHSR